MKRWSLAAIAIGLAVSAIWWFGSSQVEPPVAETHTREQIRAALSEHDLARVAELVSSSPLIELGDDDLLDLGQTLWESGYATPAETCYLQLLKQSDTRGQNAAHLKLGMLCYVTGRYHAALDHWNYLLTFGGMDMISFPLLGNRTLRFGYEDAVLDLALSRDSQDPLILMGLADRAFQNKDLDASRQWLQQALKQQANLVEAHIRLGQVFLELGDLSQVSQLVSAMPATAQKHPGYWLLIGEMYSAKEDYKSAAKCYWESLRRDAVQFAATEKLARTLQRVDFDSAADKLLERAQKIQDYAKVCLGIHLSDELQEQQLGRAAQLSAELGCFRDALSWCDVASIVFPESPWHRKLTQMVRPDLGAPLVRCEMPNLMPREFATMDLSDVPKVERSDQSESLATIRFRDQAEAVGIDFVFEDGADPSNPETALFEFTGGGVAVLDYDCDGWPDVFFPQGGPPPPEQAPWQHSDGRPSDQLFRNLSGRFASVASQSALIDGYYSQGASAGDFNDDGFADLYIANVAENSLWSNNGDGTFSEVPQQAFLNAASWTASCLMADLNADGFADLYDTNYVPLESIHTLMCISGEASIPCDPKQPLKAAQDRLFLSDGQGGFQDATSTAGVVAPEGIGLGVVAADFDADNDVDLFVANDARANFLFVNNGEEELRFSEEALLRGVAFSGQGRAQACMGVAVGDLNGDSNLDLFITNFYADYNTVYQQTPGSFLFTDETNASRMHAQSYDLLGFGTQTLDADLDGDLDLIITNGDVVDFSEVTPDRQYRQPPQFFVNDGGGHFDLVPSNDIGEFFSQASLGRGLAKLDYNLDGRADIAISHIGSPAALLENQTDCGGNYFIAIKLVGTTVDRDAIGTKIVVESNERLRTYQLTAGDGYMATNQREVIIGFRAEEQLSKLSVHWTSGTVEDDLEITPLTSRWVVREGQSPALRLQ